MVILILKTLLIIVSILLLSVIAFLCVPISYNLLFNSDNKKIEIKIYPWYLISIFNKILGKNQNLSDNINKLDKYIDIEGVKTKETIFEIVIAEEDYDTVEKQIEKFKSKNNTAEKLSSKALLKDSAKADKKISNDSDDDKNITEKLKNKFESIINIIKKLNDNDVKKLISYILTSIKNILINKNTKLYTDLTLGLDDPYLMGQLLSVISVLFAINGDRIKVLPIFNKNVFEGYIRITGKIYLMQLVVIALRIFFSKGFKKLSK